ncbi:MAG: HAD family hydrolase [Ruminococcus sp.]|nr:HAD family hydrolase [Ruminococcus sp.]
MALFYQERDKMILANIKWIFFDIGSTLVDESVAYQNRIERTIAGTNVTYDDFYNKMVEISKYNQSGYNKALEAYGLKTVPWNSDDEFVYPEAKNCLSELSKHYKIGIIANQNLGSEERLEKLGLLKHIDLVIASAEEGVAKPDLRIFQIALARADCKPEEAVMVGDRLDNDIIPANKIGMTTVWIKHGFGGYAELKEIEEHPDYTINNLNDLLNLLE